MSKMLDYVELFLGRFTFDELMNIPVKTLEMLEIPQKKIYQKHMTVKNNPIL